MTLSSEVRITEVGMRDGLQMEAKILPTHAKVQIARLLVAAGISRIEATSFVSPKKVPQLADAAEVVGELKELGTTVLALVPDLKGALRAAEAGVDEMVFFLSASETHNRSNVGRSVDESLSELARIVDEAAKSDLTVRCSIATAFGCPFEGDIAPDRVLKVVRSLRAAGISRITLGDTTGMATPPLVKAVCAAIFEFAPDSRIALHFHNTRGLGLVNVAAGLDFGIREFESSIGGLGGCPFAKGATGNVCTEDLIYMLEETGYDSGVNLPRVIKAAHYVQDLLGHELPGQVMKSGPRL